MGLLNKVTFNKEERLNEIRIQKELIRTIWKGLEEEEFNLNKIKVINKG